MRRSPILIGLSATSLVLPLWASVSATATEKAPSTAKSWTELVSDDGGDGGRELPAMSADGKFVVLAGRGSAAGIWVKNRAKPGVASKQVATGDLQNPAISADGEVIAWAAYGASRQVWAYRWRDQNARPFVVSVSDDGAESAKPSDFPSVSGNGRYIAFQSMDESLDSEAAQGKSGGGPNKVYVRDTRTGDTEMVSLVDVESGADQIVNGNAIKPDITADGRFVAFASDASVLQPAAAEGETTYQQVYVRNRGTDSTRLVSRSSSGEIGNGASSTLYGPSISDDGKRVAFESLATNLVPNDTNADTDAFVRDRSAVTTTRVSVLPGGGQADTDDTADTTDEEGAFVDAAPVGVGPVISGNGAFVAFESDAALTSDDKNSGTASCGDITDGYVFVTDIYRTRISNLGVTRWSVAEPRDSAAFEATGYRIDGNTGECVAANNGVDPTISYNGLRIGFVSNGNLTGISVEAEDGSTAVPTAIEPMSYLRRPNPEPDRAAPNSSARSPKYVTTNGFRVTYRTGDPFPSRGVKKIQLWVKRPGSTVFRLVDVDKGSAINHRFWFSTNGVDGTYRFYTLGTDKAGHHEKAPGRADSVTRKS